MTQGKKTGWFDFLVNAVFAAVPVFFLIVLVFFMLFPELINDVTMSAAIAASIIIGIIVGITSRYR